MFDWNVSLFFFHSCFSPGNHWPICAGWIADLWFEQSLLILSCFLTTVSVLPALSTVEHFYCRYVVRGCVLVEQQIHPLVFQKLNWKYAVCLLVYTQHGAWVMEKNGFITILWSSKLYSCIYIKMLQEYKPLEITEQYVLRTKATITQNITKQEEHINNKERLGFIVL